MHEPAEGALWRWVTDGRGSRLRFGLALRREELIAVAGVRPGWYQLIPFGRDGHLTQDPPAMIAATGGPAADVVRAEASAVRIDGRPESAGHAPELPSAAATVSDRLFRTLRRGRPGHRVGH